MHRLELGPLTDAQQMHSIRQRLGEEDAAELAKYIFEKVPLDPETKQRVTGNPLMLAMVVAVFELRRGIGMPKTIAELYKTAAEAMLARGGAAAAEVRAVDSNMKLYLNFMIPLKSPRAQICARFLTILSLWQTSNSNLI